MPLEKTNTLYWRLCSLAVVLLCVLTFTPLVIPAGQYMPLLAGLPLTLWSGLLIAWVLVALTFIGVYVHPGDEPTASEDL